MVQPESIRRPPLDALRKYRVFYKDGSSYQVRILTRGEALFISASSKTTSETHDTICKNCLIDGTNPERLLAGRVTSLATFILDKSGFLDDKECILAKEADEWIDTLEGKMEVLAMSYLQGCTLDYLWSCDTVQWFYIMKAAQYTAAVLHNIDLEAYFKPEEAAKKAQQRAMQSKTRPAPGYKQVEQKQENAFSWSKK